MDRLRKRSLFSPVRAFSALTVISLLAVPGAWAQDTPQPPADPPKQEEPKKQDPVPQDPVVPETPPVDPVKPETPPVINDVPKVEAPKPKPTPRPAPKPAPKEEPVRELKQMSGITFAERRARKTLYIPLRPAAEALGWYISREKTGLEANGKPVPTERAEKLLDGTLILPVRDLQQLGANVHFDAETGNVIVSAGRRVFTVAPGEKRVEVDISKQELKAYQGDFVVLNTHISTGRTNNTPRGEFTAGPYKTPMHYSSLYNNSPMPWSVQIEGDIFFHGYSSVPPYPASHGCVRMPLDGGNPARFLYQWIDRGTPVKIYGDWKGRRKR